MATPLGRVRGLGSAKGGDEILCSKAGIWHRARHSDTPYLVALGIYCSVATVMPPGAFGARPRWLSLS
jgi:hypothetical protein